MTEIAQLFESALRQNRANLLRKAAINTVAKMPAQTTLHELLSSEAGSSIRELTLVELREALAGFVSAASPSAPASTASTAGSAAGARRIPVAASANGQSGPNNGSGESLESREARLYRQIIEACSHEPKTIGQLAKVVDVDVVELRGYLAWMKKMGKIDSSGRARATRYHLPQS
jgi:hypothetical protein